MASTSIGIIIGIDRDIEDMWPTGVAPLFNHYPLEILESLCTPEPITPSNSPCLVKLIMAHDVNDFRKLAFKFGFTRNCSTIACKNKATGRCLRCRKVYCTNCARLHFILHLIRDKKNLRRHETTLKCFEKKINSHSLTTKKYPWFDLTKKYKDISEKMVKLDSSISKERAKIPIKRSVTFTI